jgi:MtN3 and saliva related transmembrane protein
MMTIATFIEMVFGLGLFINAALFIPQIIKLYKTKNAQGLSLVTFAGFNFIQLFTILHGYLHKDLLLIIGYVISFIACGVVTTMIILYKSD